MIKKALSCFFKKNVPSDSLDFRVSIVQKCMVTFFFGSKMVFDLARHSLRSRILVPGRSRLVVTSPNMCRPACPRRRRACTDHVPRGARVRWSVRRNAWRATYPRPRPAFSPAPPLLRLPQFPGTESSGSDDASAAMADVAAADGARSPTTTPPKPQLFEADAHQYKQDVVMLRRTRSGRTFPPPISVIGRSGRPWLRLRASREGGRLVLREMRLPSQELLQPCKEDGRFKLLLHTEPGARRGNAGTAREE